MKIGLVIYGSLATLSGGYLYDRKLVEYLRAQGDTVEIISLPWRNYTAHLTDNFWFRLPGVVARSRRSSAPKARIETEATKQSPIPQKFDILIQDELNHPSLVFANRGKHPCPIISLVHHLRCSELRPKWQNAFYRVIEKKYLQSVDGFIFNSKTTEKVVDGMLANQKPGVIAYPPTDHFGEPISAEEIEHRARGNPFRIVFLGNVIERKGLHTLLKAINSQQLEFRLDVIGSLTSDPGYAKQIREFIARHHLSSFVSLHGSLIEEFLIEKLRQAHVLVVPSSYEGFGIVYLEGMCFGLPALGTTAGAAGEIISDGVDGFLIEPDDAKSLAAHLTSLAKDRDMLVRLSLNARQRYLRQPVWEATAESIRSFLYSVVK